MHSLPTFAASFDNHVAATPMVSAVDIARSRTTARRIEARNGQCYRNAVYALLTSDELQNEGAQYVEGLTIAHNSLVTPMEHAWLELPGGTIVDPTPAYCDASAPPRTYFAAFRWSAARTLALITEKGATYGFRYGMDADGRLEKEWRKAAISACAAAEALCQANGQSLLASGMTVEALARGM